MKMMISASMWHRIFLYYLILNSNYFSYHICTIILSNTCGIICYEVTALESNFQIFHSRFFIVEKMEPALDIFEQYELKILGVLKF